MLLVVHSPAQKPSPQEIERFIPSIVGKVKPLGGEIPSHVWMKTSIDTLVKALTSKHADFQLRVHDTDRLDAVVDSLWRKGLLTKEPKRHKQWVGVVIVRKLASAIFEHALSKGTRCWDVTVSRTLSLVLVSCLNSRPGDVLLSNMNENEYPCMIYRDIHMNLAEGSTLENLVGRFTIRNGKGFK